MVPLDETDPLMGRYGGDADRREPGGGGYGASSGRGDRHPTLIIRKYAKNDLNMMASSEGDKPSDLYRAIEYLDEYFYTEMSRRLENKQLILSDPRRDNHAVGGEKNGSTSLIIPSAKIVPMVQTRVSQTTPSPDAGKRLENPICRLNIKVTGGQQQGVDKRPPWQASSVVTKFYDYTKPVEDAATGVITYQPLLLDGAPVDRQNIHKIGKRAIVSGIVNLSAVCFSTMGISIPTSIGILIVYQQSSTLDMDIRDVLDGMPPMPLPDRRQPFNSCSVVAKTAGGSGESCISDAEEEAEEDDDGNATPYS
jgi:hypothetical protein